MPLDFPNAPSLNQTYTGPTGVIWSWDGAKWTNATLSSGYAPIDTPVFTGNPQAPNPPVGDADTSVATTSFVSAAVATANHNVGRNLLHNPLFAVAQRGAGPFTANGYTLDRWALAFANDTNSISLATLVDSQRAQVGDEAATYALSNTFAGNAAAGAFSIVRQSIEGVRRLAGKTVTVSFWAAVGSGAPRLGVSFDQSFGTGGSPSAVVIINGQSVALSTTWTRYSVSFVLPSASGKTLGTNGDDNTTLDIWYSSGSTNNIRSGSVGVQSGIISVWGVQLEIGSVATPLEKPDPQQDLAKCQRFAQLISPALRGFASGAGQHLSVTATYPQMRATPTATGVAGGASLNITGVAFNTVTNNSGFYDGSSSAAGDFYASSSVYLLSADL